MVRDKSSVFMMPVLVALIGIGGVLVVQQQRNAQALQQAQIESMTEIARADRELRVLEIFATMITSADPAQRRVGLEMMAVLDGELARKLEGATHAAAPVRSERQSSGDPTSAERDSQRSIAEPRTVAHRIVDGAPGERSRATIYLHFRRDSDRDIAAALTERLEEQGYEVAAIERVADRGPAESQLRYFADGGEGEARAILKALSATGIVVVPTYIPGYGDGSRAPDHYELWLAPGPAPTAAPEAD